MNGGNYGNGVVFALDLPSTSGKAEAIGHAPEEITGDHR